MIERWRMADGWAPGNLYFSWLVNLRAYRSILIWQQCLWSVMKNKHSISLLVIKTTVKVSSIAELYRSINDNVCCEFRIGIIYIYLKDIRENRNFSHTLRTPNNTLKSLEKYIVYHCMTKRNVYIIQQQDYRRRGMCELE